MRCDRRGHTVMTQERFNNWLLRYPVVDVVLAIFIGVPLGTAIGIVAMLAMNSARSTE